MRLISALPYVLPLMFPLCSVLGQQVEQTLEEKRAAIAVHFRSFEYGQTFLKQPKDVAFVTVSFDDLPKTIKGPMYSRLGFILEWDAHPQTRGRPLEAGRMLIRAFAVTNKEQHDLVEYSWLYMGQNLRVVVSINAMRLDIDLRELADNPELSEFGRTRVRRAIGLVENIVRMRGETFSLDPQPFEVHIPWPDVLTDGTRFSTSPNRNISSMNSVFWFHRIDFSVHDQTLSVMFYFKPGQLVGPQDGSKWFPNEFRALVHEKARDQGKPAPDTPESEE